MGRAVQGKVGRPNHSSTGKRGKQMVAAAHAASESASVVTGGPFKDPGGPYDTALPDDGLMRRGSVRHHGGIGSETVPSSTLDHDRAAYTLFAFSNGSPGMHSLERTTSPTMAPVLSGSSGRARSALPSAIWGPSASSNRPGMLPLSGLRNAEIGDDFSQLPTPYPSPAVASARFGSRGGARSAPSITDRFSYGLSSTRQDVAPTLSELGKAFSWVRTPDRNTLSAVQRPLSWSSDHAGSVLATPEQVTSSAKPAMATPESSHLVQFKTKRSHGESAESPQQKKPFLHGYVNGKMDGLGLPNIGNTCYMNSVLQVLLKIPSFPKDLSSELEQGLKSSLGRLLIELNESKLARGRQLDDGTSQVLSDIKQLLPKSFQGATQQDAHEFLNEILDQLRAKTPSSPPGGSNATKQVATSPVHASPAPTSDCAVLNNFCGVQEKSYVCCKCKHEFVNEEDFTDILMRMPSSDRSSPDLGQWHDMAEMLSASLENEDIEVTCDKCHHGRAILRKTLRKLPRVLVLHVNRTWFDKANQCSGKSKARVNISPLLSVDHLCALKVTPPRPFVSTPSISTPVLKSASDRPEEMRPQPGVPSAAATPAPAGSAVTKLPVLSAASTPPAAAPAAASATPASTSSPSTTSPAASAMSPAAAAPAATSATPASTSSPGTTSPAASAMSPAAAASPSAFTSRSGTKSAASSAASSTPAVSPVHPLAPKPSPATAGIRVKRRKRSPLFPDLCKSAASSAASSTPTVSPVRPLAPKPSPATYRILVKPRKRSPLLPDSYHDDEWSERHDNLGDGSPTRLTCASSYSKQWPQPRKLFDTVGSELRSTLDDRVARSVIASGGSSLFGGRGSTGSGSFHSVTAMEDGEPDRFRSLLDAPKPGPLEEDDVQLKLALRRSIADMQKQPSAVSSRVTSPTAEAQSACNASKSSHMPPLSPPGAAFKPQFGVSSHVTSPTAEAQSACNASTSSHMPPLSPPGAAFKPQFGVSSHVTSPTAEAQSACNASTSSHMPPLSPPGAAFKPQFGVSSRVTSPTAEAHSAVSASTSSHMPPPSPPGAAFKPQFGVSSHVTSPTAKAHYAVSASTSTPMPPPSTPCFKPRASESSMPATAAPFRMPPSDRVDELPPVQAKPSGSQVYHLVAVVSHIGDDSSNGHYVSDVMDTECVWRTYNDRFVTETTESEVRKTRAETAYLFFLVHQSMFKEAYSRSK